MPPSPRKPLPALSVLDDPGLSPVQRHCRKWAGGCGNDVCDRVRRRCFYRGTVPCQVLFLAQAPGDSEDFQGLPLVGPAGILLQERVINVAVPDGVTYACANLLSCKPTYEDGTKRHGTDEEPDDDEVRACRPRLEEFVQLARPRLIVAVGSVARDWLDPKAHPNYRIDVGTVPVVAIEHPAAILRANVSVKTLKVQKCVVTVRDAVEEYVGGLPQR